MLRRTALLVYRDTATADERSRLMRGLAFLGLECPTVAAGDYGDDIAGGSARLIEIPPWKRTPRFHARDEGPPSNYDLALHLDFEDEAALAAYEGHRARQEMLRSASAVTVPDLTARLDWRHDGQLNARGGYRHCALHVWRDGTTEAARSRALDAVRGLVVVPDVAAVLVGESANGRPADFDWILDVRFDDEHAARSFPAAEPYAEAVQAVAEVTKHEWTARVTHLIRECDVALLLEEMTWPEVRDAAAQGLPVVLPVGATEQHGPHLPLNTDCLIPVAIASETAKRLPLVIAPPIRFGAKSRPLSGGGENFPGTISLSGHTLIDTLREVLSALARSGFTRLCLQNWHFENAGFLWEAADLTARDHPDVRIVVLDRPLPEFTAEERAKLFPPDHPGQSVEHAASMETSLMLAVHPEFVRRDRIADDSAARRPTWEVVPAPPEIVAPSGVLWRPSEGSAEIGRLYLEAAAGRLETALRTEFGL